MSPEIPTTVSLPTLINLSMLLNRNNEPYDPTWSAAIITPFLNLEAITEVPVIIGC
ncbi:Uncharacterised protein [Chlamydia trachomatis]|nr:Uncharacterised protein [Chlamydia trachomatis]